MEMNHLIVQAGDRLSRLGVASPLIRVHGPGSGTHMSPLHLTRSFLTASELVTTPEGVADQRHCPGCQEQLRPRIVGAYAGHEGQNMIFDCRTAIVAAGIQHPQYLRLLPFFSMLYQHHHHHYH